MKRSLKGKSILVTGGAGFIGSHLVDRLAAENPTAVVVVDNLYLGQEKNLDQGKQLLGDRLHFYNQDAGDQKAMQEILARHKVEVVYDMAVIPLPASLEDPVWCVMENTKLTTALCELQRQGCFQSMVHFSSSEVYGTAIEVPITEQHPYMPSTPYAASKLAGDQVALSYAHTFGSDITCLRPFNNYGPRQNDKSFAGIIPIVVNKVLAGEPLTVNGDGLQTRDYIYVTDTAEAAVRIYEEEAARGQVLNIGSGKELTVNDLIACILDILGKPNHLVQHGPNRLGDVRRHMAGTVKSEQILNYHPKVSLTDGMRQTVQWYVEKSTN
jgi:UDP-glucose 4-epimerase